MARPVVGIGEVLWDLLPAGKQLGGAPANFAFHAGQLGADDEPKAFYGDLLHDPEFRSPLAWGSYPMVPWAGRIRHGRFRFDGEEYELPINFGAHAIHGVGFGTGPPYHAGGCGVSSEARRSGTWNEGS